jgi:hypothetical protein
MGTCIVQSGSARLTGLGFSFAPRTLADSIPTLSKFMSLATFGIQRDRMAENARRDAEEAATEARLSMLPQALLQMAMRHAA